MADTTEEQKKAVVPFLQRAEEIERVEPKVAYYCRMYAVEQGLALPSRSPQIDGLLGALLAKLEKDKPVIAPGGDDAAHCERFALGVFARADKVDRAGRADKATATAFYAASIFFEILNQFGPLASDLAEMQRYAAWKAADIRKAVREGRTPTPGPPGDGGDGVPADAGGDGGVDLPSPPSAKPPGQQQLPRSDSTVGGGGAAPPPRFAPGAAVLYCHDGHGPPVPGTVGTVHPPEGLGVTYGVALAAQVVSAFEAQLAPAVGEGDAVTVGGGGGADADAGAPPPGEYVVTAVDASVWRPRYTVKPKAGGGGEATVDDRALAAWPPPRGRAPPPAVKSDAPFAAPHAPPPEASAPSAPPPPPAAKAAPAPAAPAAAAPPPTAAQPSLKAMQDAIKAAKCAVSSLQFEDVPTAVKYLREALRELGEK